MIDDDAPQKVQPQGKRGGQWITIGTEQYRIPPLAFAAVQELQDEVRGLAAMGDRPTPDQMGTVAKIVQSAMARNYPTITTDEINGMLDLGNYQAVLGAVLAVAGFTKEAADGSGEAKASTGTPSTAP